MSIERQMIPSPEPVIDQGIEDLKPLYSSIDEKEFSQLGKGAKPTQNIKEEDFSKYNQTSYIENDLSLLTPLKAPKSYGTYSKQQQEDVIAFIKDGHSLRTAEKVFGIPKSTMHCWLKKLHIKSELLNTMKVEAYPELNVDTYNSDTTYMDESGTKVLKQWKDGRNHNVQRKSSPPSSPIIIEESELIRFLQTTEGLEMIAKAYGLTVSDFLNFVNSSKSKVQDNVKGLLVSTASSRPMDVIGVFDPQKKSLDVKDNIKYYQQVSPNTVRKRNLHNNDYFSFDKSVYPGVAVLQKKIKVEQNTHDIMDRSGYESNSDTFIKNSTGNIDSRNKRSNKNNRKNSNGNNIINDENINKNRNIDSINNITDNRYSKNDNNRIINNNNSNNDNVGNNTNSRNMNTMHGNGSLLASLLSKDSIQKPGMQRKLVLTTKQYLAANKIINSVQPDNVTTYLSSKPLLASMVNSHSQYDQKTNAEMTHNSDNTQTLEQTADLSFGYSTKVTNPVSIKAERLDSEISLPCDVSPNNRGMHFVRTMTPVISSITRPVVTSNNTATLNLNEINRTQSEKELMAMVDGNNVSADELCAEFKETLEITKWVDNETWYMDQYLQHFQVSPAVTSPGSSSHPDSDEEEEVNTGLTFAVDKKMENNNNINKTLLAPVAVKIYEQGKNTGEVWSTLSSPGGRLSTSPQTHDGLLSSPRLYDGLLCSPRFTQGGGLCSPRMYDRGLLNSPGKEQLLTHLSETGLDPNLVQPNYSTFE